MLVSSYSDLLLMVLVLVAAAHDLATRRIPNQLLLCGAFGAMLLHLLSATPGAALWSGLGGALCGLLLFLPLYLLRGMAAGDVKLMATVGFFGAPGAALHTGLLSVCAGGLLALVVVLATGRLGAAWRNVKTLLRPWLLRLAGARAPSETLGAASVGNIPYGLAIAAGTLLAMAERYHAA